MGAWSSAEPVCLDAVLGDLERLAMESMATPSPGHAPRTLGNCRGRSAVSSCLGDSLLPLQFPVVHYAAELPHHFLIRPNQGKKIKVLGFQRLRKM